MKPTDQVKLSFACQQNWETFTQVAGGRLCGTCKHIVHDFTNSTPEEVAKVMKDNPGRVCGRFRSLQPESSMIKRAAVVTASIALAACFPEVTPATDDTSTFDEDRYFPKTTMPNISSDTVVEEHVLMGMVLLPDSLNDEMDNLNENDGLKSNE